MHLARALIVLSLLAVAGSARADKAPPPREIDKTYQACLDKAPDDQAQLACIAVARSAWDKVLNANYKSASAGLDDEKRTLLQNAQRQWLHYRDADQAFRDSDWRFGDAFDKKVFLADTGMRIVKARALALATYGPPVE